MAADEHAAAPRLIYEAVIKVLVSDPPDKRSRDIAEGIGYACALLMDEYGWSADQIESAVQPYIDDAYDQEEQRRGR